jgi:hypothetical protein
MAWTHPDEVNEALLEFLGATTSESDRTQTLSATR